MATFKICVFEHQKRKDDKYRVSIRLSHNRQRVYMATDTYVVKKQVSADFQTLRDTDVARRIDRDILKYEELLLKGLGSTLSQYTARELADYISKHINMEGGAGIDFVSFANSYISQLKDKGRKSYAEGFEAVIRALIDFFGRDIIFIKEINAKNLQQFEAHMSTTRTMVRVNQHGAEYTITRKPVKSQTIADYVGAIKTLFNAACDEYNDENDEKAIITHNPFRKYKIKVTEEPEKRSLTVKELVKIIDYTGDGGRRLELARDVFLMSFYLIGMNTADLFNVEATAIKDGRITYKRQKTTTRRKDEAVISVKIEPEVLTLFKKYNDGSKKKAFAFYRMYADHHTFNANLNKGLKQLSTVLGITPQLSTYYARHTWATIADNHCGIGESDIGLALNHVGDKDMKVTRGYITKDPTKIDGFNRKVLDFVKSKSQPAIGVVLATF